MIGPLGENLIFVIAPPRSGTTMLQRVLCSHSQVHATAEPWIMLHPIYALRDCGHSAEYWAFGAASALREFLESSPDGRDTYIKALRQFGVTLYNSVLAPTGKTCFLDKTPRYYYVVPELREIFPRAKFVFLLRNPLALLASVLSEWVKEDWARLANSKADLFKGPVCMDAALHDFKEKAIVVRYENFVSAPDPAAVELCVRLGLPFELSMLNYGEHAAPRGTMGDALVHQHSRPVDASLDKWTRVFSADPRALSLAMRYLHMMDDGILSRLGYPKDSLLQVLDSLVVTSPPPQPGPWEGAADEFLS